MVTNLSRENIFKNILTLLSGSAVSQIALALSVFLTAKVLGVELFGVYTSCFALTKISSILINLGVDSWLLREGSYRPEKAERFVGDIFSIKLIAGIGWFLLIIGLSFFLDSNVYPRGFLLLVAVATWTDSILITCQSVFKLLLKNTITAILSFISGIALLGITILFILQGVDQPGPYAWARLVVTAITLLVAALWVSKTVHLKLPRFINFEVIRGAFPFMISEGLYLVYMYADINLIALMLGEYEAGIYSPATSILSALYVVPQAIFTVMVPVLTYSMAHRSENTGAIIRWMNLGLFGLGAAMWAVTGLLGPQIIGLLGEQYAGTGEILRILSVILFFKSLGFGMAVILTSVGWQKQRVQAQAVSAVVTILLNLYVIRAFGISGAAWVFVFGEAILLIGYAIPAAKWKQAVTQLKAPEDTNRQFVTPAQPSTTRVLIINLHSTRNAGDATLMDLAIAEARHAFPECEITLAMNDPASYVGGEEVVSSVGKLVKTSRPGSTGSWSSARLVWFLVSSFFTVIFKQITGKTVFLTRIKEERKLIQAYLRADLVISAPGNFLYSSGGFGIGMLITVYSMAYARLAGKPLYILPQTIGPLTRKRDERLVRWILLRSRMVFIREEQSARQLQRVGIPPTRFHLVPDLAFTAPASPRSETDAILRQHGVDPQDRQPLLGVTLIDWGAQNRNFQHQERYEEAVYHAVRHFVDCHQGKAIFFAQVTGPTPADDDRIPAQRVARRLQTEGKAVAFVEEALPPAVLKSAYGSMDLFLGSRLHSTIFALSSGVPTIGIGYQPKTIGVFQMLGLEPWVFEIDEVDPERLSEKLDLLWQQRKDLAAVIKDRIAQVQAESTQVADKIAKNYAAYVAEKAR